MLAANTVRQVFPQNTESMNRPSAAKLILLLVVIACAVAGALKVKEWIDIDRCLDSGGRWNYETKQCEH
jgi:hypothetical protein